MWQDLLLAHKKGHPCYTTLQAVDGQRSDRQCGLARASSAVINEANGRRHPFDGLSVCFVGMRPESAGNAW